MHKTAELKGLVNPDLLKGMADTGEPWSAGCVRVAGRAYKHLNWASRSDKYVLMVYESGGIAHFVNIRLSPIGETRALWERYLKAVPPDVEAVKKMIKGKELDE